MRAWTLEQLKLADELAFPSDVNRILAEIGPDYWQAIALDIKERGLMRNIFVHSRADYRGELGTLFDELIARLLKVQS